MNSRWVSLPAKLVCGALAVLAYCEFAHYYAVLWQCRWPAPCATPPLHVLLLADPHLLGPTGHWFDRLRREWQMERSFQTALQLLAPKLVFILGDVLDEGKWTPDQRYLQDFIRYQRIFRAPNSTTVYSLAGNHDIGFHYSVTAHKHRRFVRHFNVSAMELITVDDVNFVLVNSVAFEGDECFLCKEAQKKLKVVGDRLGCSGVEGVGRGANCSAEGRAARSRPILLQHYPMHRASDAQCAHDEPDAMPVDESGVPFRPRWDCLSQQASDQLAAALNPRLVVTGHTHYYCETPHPTFVEYTLPSFSWRNIKQPGVLLLTAAPHCFAVAKCLLPNENTIYMLYAAAALLLFFYAFYSFCFFIFFKFKRA